MNHLIDEEEFAHEYGRISNTKIPNEKNGK